LFIDALVKIHQFSKALGSFLRAWEVDFVTNLRSYLRRKDYTFSKEIFGCIAVRKKLGNHASLLRDRDILFLEERLRKA
jgi:hypothetical protein